MLDKPSRCFPFKLASDSDEKTIYRPIIELRPEGSERDQTQSCLVDTGTPNTYLDWQLASLAGIDLDQTKKIPTDSWFLGGVKAEELWEATVAFVIDVGRRWIRLGDIRVIFWKPWRNPDFAVVLGTNGLGKVEIIVDAGINEGKLAISQQR